MRLLADENIPLATVAALQGAGHDVASVSQLSPGITDEMVMSRAVAEGRILLTLTVTSERWPSEKGFLAPMESSSFGFGPGALLSLRDS